MATTIPCILRALGNRFPTGFTLKDLEEAFILDGYGSEKAVRRCKQVRLSGEIIPIETEEGSFYFTIYNPYHVLKYPELGEVRVRAVKITRDGTPIVLTP